MSGRTSSPKSRVNRSPAEGHHHQMIWQIWVPLGGSILLILALAILTVVGAFRGNSQIERWGNLSAVWVILPVLLFGVIFIAITVAIVYGVSRLLGKIPGWMLRLQLFMIQVGLVVRRAADSATKPVMAVNGIGASVNTLWRELFHRK